MSSQSDETPALAREDISYEVVGDRIAELAAQLQMLANALNGERKTISELWDELEAAQDMGVDSDDPEFRDALDTYYRRTGALIAQTLIGLRTHRRAYNYLERAITEWAVHVNPKISQRDAARYLGVANNTINRWTANPLEVETDK